MGTRTEELVNDPGNHALLKALASEKSQTLERASAETGIDPDRLRRKAESLQQKGLIEVDRTSSPMILKMEGEHRESLKKIKDELDSFHEEKHDLVLEENEKELERLSDLKARLNEEMDETDLFRREKKIRSKIERIDNCMERIREAETSEESFEAFSHSHRTLKNIGSRDQDFHSFNPFRKLKASQKLAEVLEENPDEHSPRRFFGNRWVTQDSIE